MKKLFKNFMFVFLFMVISILGITSVNAQSKNIEVTDIKIKDKTGTITVEEPTITDGTISSGIKFNEVGDYVTFELILKDNESDKYKITSITDNNENENIEIDYTYDKDFIDEDETTKVTVKLTYKKKLVNQNISLNDLQVKLNLEKEDGSSSQITINPQTGDNILRYVALLIMSGLGLFFVITKKRIKGFKVGNLLLIISVILIPFTVLATEKYELSIKFTDIEVKGEFEVYNITIDPKDGSSIVIKDITYGQPIGELPNNPTKEGYEFINWVDEDGNEITEESIITKPIEVEAKYETIRYNITYNLNGGSLPSGKTNPSKYTIESEEITLNNPEKQGYTFSGWSGTGIDGQTTSVTISHGSTEDRSYEAHYSANEDTEYKVIHKFAKLNGDYEIEEVTEHGTTGSTVPVPRKTRTGFVTPTVQNVTIEADGSASVTYTYEREEYAFNITDRTYVDNTSTADGTYKYGTEITVKAVNRAGYDFEWSDGDTNLERTFTLESAKELTPIYTAKTNTKYVVKHYKQKVTLDGYDLVEQDIQNLDGVTDSPITPAVNTYYGFISPEVQNTTIKGDESTVVEYKYNRKSFNVTFDTDGGSAVSEQSIIYDAKASRPTTIPQKEHYTFDDWYTSDTYETKYDFNTMTITEDTVIYAKYNLVKYTVTFESNGGTEIDSQEVEYGKKATRPETNPELFDREFDDWYTTDSYATKYNFDTMTISGDTTIYAKYNDLCNGFSTDSWSTIKTNVEDDPDYYPVGCRKEVQLDMNNDNTKETYKVRIVNTSSPDICAKEGYSQTACGTVIEFEETVGNRRINDSNTTAGGWKETEIVTYLNGEFYNKLPSNLKNAIIPTYPIVSGSGKDVPSDDITEEDIDKNKIYFFSTREVGFGGQFDNKANVETDTRVLDYYIGTAENSSKEEKRIKYNVNNEVQNWMLRSADSRNTDTYLAVGSSGALNGVPADENYAYNYAMAPAFRIATIPKYTVIFDSNGGSGSMTNQGIYSGISTKLSLNTFTAPENMKFDSWNTKEDGSGTSYTDEENINLEKSDGETITLYAQWKPTMQTWSMTSDNVHVTDGYITLEVGDQITGYSVDVDNTTYGDGDWFVMGAKDGKLLITLKLGVGQKVVQGNALNWPSFVANLDNIASHYKNPTYADNSRSINLSDINRVTGFTPYEMESITFTNDNGIIRTKDIPDELNVYPRDFYYYDFESSSWKKLGNGSSISFASNGYKYGPDPDQNNVNGSEKAYDLIFKDTHDKNWMIDGHVVTYRGNQYWLADAVIMTSSGQGMIYYCFQYIDWEIVDWVIAGASNDNPANSSYSEFDNFVRPVVTLKSEVHVNASGTIIN